MSRQWWEKQRPLYSCWISDAVTLELQEGDWTGKEEALGLIENLPRLEIDSEVIAVAQKYIGEQLVPGTSAQMHSTSRSRA